MWVGTPHSGEDHIDQRAMVSWSARGRVTVTRDVTKVRIQRVVVPI